MPFEQDGTQFYSVTEVAKQVGVTRQTLHRWIKEGKVNRPSNKRPRDDRPRFYSEPELEAINVFANQVEPVDTASPNQMGLFNNVSTGEES